MTDYDDDQTPNTNALNDARRLQAAAGQRGGYPRGFALATAVWAGVLTTGIAGFLYSRHQQGAWVNEATSHSDLLRIFGGATLIVLIGIAGFIGRHKLELGFAPYLCGLVVGVSQYLMMQLSRAHTGAHIA